MAQGSTEPERARSSTPAADGASLQGSGDASRPTGEERLRQELSVLREELKLVATAYQELTRKVERLKKVPTPPTPEQTESSKRFLGRLAPLTKINGKRTDLLRNWFEMLPTYLRVSGIDPESRDAVLFTVAHFEPPLTKWFINRKLANGGDEAAGFSRISELREACLEFHRERDPERTARDKLKRAYQTGSVLQYAHRLEEIYLSIPEHPEAAKVHDFVFGLKPKIRESVQLLEPKTFSEAVRIAQEKENANSDAQGPSPMDVDLHAATTAPGPKKPNLKGPLTAERKRLLRKMGACFYCRKQGHILSECPEKKTGN